MSAAFALACSVPADATPVPAATTSAAPCPTYELIGARGSGQTADRFDRMGPEIYDFFKRLSLALPGSALRGYGVRYRAVSVWPTVAGAAAFLHFGGSYTDSVREGARDVMRELTEEHRRCRGTRFVLAGYSQGAQAIGDAIQKDMSAAERGLIAAVAFFGDPYFKADSWSARTSDPSHYGIFGPRPEWADDLHGKVFSYCHAHDPICSMSTRHHILGDGEVYVRDLLNFDTGQHLTPAYVAQGDTASAASDVAQALGAQLAVQPYSGPLDIAFVIDSTGSMADEIASVQANVDQLVSQIGSIDPDFRVALVDYKDVPDEDSDYQSRLDVDFTNDVGALTTAVDSLTAEGGGDTPESVYSGIMTALGLSWRAGAKKLVVQIGDAPPKDPEPLTGYTLDSVRQRALSVDPAIVDTVQTGSDEDAQSSLSAIAAATAGTYLQLPDESDAGALIPAIEGAVQQSAVAPLARIAVPAEAVADTPAAFSAAGSSGNGDAIAGYDWDFDGDGVYDLTTTDPVAVHTYPGPYGGAVTVRVRAQSGLAALATAAVNVAATATVAPPRPQRLRAEVGDRSVTLSWTMAAGAQARWVTIRAGRTLLARVEAGPDGAPQRWRGGGLVNGRRYAFTVRAGNEHGNGPAAGPVRAVPLGVDALSHLRVSPRVVSAGSGKGAIVLSYVGTAPSRTVVALQRLHGKRWTTLARFAHRDRAGAVRVRLPTRIGAQQLAPGRYRLRLTTHNRRGAGRPVTAAFRVRR